jgi:hypothetical protein
MILINIKNKELTIFSSKARANSQQEQENFTSQ